MHVLHMYIACMGAIEGLPGAKGSGGYVEEKTGQVS